MPEATKLMKPVRVTYTCDTCGQGEMKSTGYGMLTSPPKYAHQCTRCGAQQTFRCNYPTIRYEEA